MTSAQDSTKPLSRWDASLPSYIRWGEPVSTVFAAEALRRVAPTPGMRILDVGAGPGNLAVPAAARGCSVLAIDNSPVMVETLNERLAPYEDSRAELMDARDLQIGIATFDAIFSVLCVTFISDSEDIFGRMVRAVKPGGTMALVHWATAHGAPYFEVLNRALKRLGFDDEAAKPPVDTFLVPAELEDALRAAGCRDVEVTPLVAACEFPEPDACLDELDLFFAANAAYRGLDQARKRQLAKLIAEDVARIPIVDGRRAPPCSANLFVATTDRTAAH